MLKGQVLTGHDILIILKLYDLTQHEIGVMAGVSQSTVFKIENNYVDLNPEVAKKITDRMGITTERLAFIRGVYAELQSNKLAAINRVKRVKGINNVKQAAMSL